MAIGTAHPERGHRRGAPSVNGPPRREFVGQPQTLFLPIDFAAGLVDVQCRRDRGVLGGQNDLHKAQPARRRLSMPDV